MHSIPKDIRKEQWLQKRNERESYEREIEIGDNPFTNQQTSLAQIERMASMP